mgnify:FL=1|tara:strand:- start:1298 stop:1696 length:399 start_codon:yes stop_codon:yes gene_type:complete
MKTDPDTQFQLFQPINGLGGYRETVKPLPMVRNTDPVTSHKAAKSALPRTSSQKIRLLSVYRSHRDMTADEAGIATGLSEKAGCCYWHRVSDLIKEGLIEPTGETRLARSGEQQRVNRITESGRELLKRLGL